jgi:hypothetical protein
VITDKGLAELRQWIGPPFPEWTVAPTFDPVRTRLMFLAAVSPATRRRFIAEAQAMMREKIVDVKELLELSTERFDRLTLVGCVFDLEARIRWLDVVKETLGGSPDLVSSVAFSKCNNIRESGPVLVIESAASVSCEFGGNGDEASAFGGCYCVIGDGRKLRECLTSGTTCESYHKSRSGSGVPVPGEC